MLLEPGESVVAVGDALDLVAFDFEAGAKSERQRLVVLEDEYRAIHRDVATGGLPGVGHGAAPFELL